MEAALLIVPVLGAVGTQLVPHRKAVDAKAAGVMVSTAVVNAVGEELLWRGVFLEEFPADSLRGAVWPLVGFSLWHLAPQLVFPSSFGRWRFVLGAALVGSASTVSARRSRGLRNCLIPHIATDACGVSAAQFRLGRATTPAHA